MRHRQFLAAGSKYVLPYKINITAQSNQWLVVNEVTGGTSDLVNYANIDGGSVGVINVYSDDSDGDMAAARLELGAISSSASVNGPTYAAAEDSTGLAFYSTYIDTGGVPGDPSPHPTVEAWYNIQSSAATVPEPASLTLFGSVAVMGLARWLWRCRRK